MFKLFQNVTAIVPYRRSNFDYSREINQQLNLNTNSRLWIQPDNTVFKQYVIFNDMTQKNIRTLLTLSQIDYLYSIKELTMPIIIYKSFGRICGYSMLFCSGKPMSCFLHASDIDVSTQHISLINLANTINELPDNVFIGDLHGENVLVQPDGTIHLIDIDGFSVSGNESTCPLSTLSWIWGIDTLKKYHYQNGKFKISRESDIFCFYLLYLSWLIQKDCFKLSKEELYDSIDYLHHIKEYETFAESFENLFTEKPNTIDVTSLYDVCLDYSQLYRYDTHCSQSKWLTNCNRVRGGNVMSLRDRVKDLEASIENTSFDDFILRADRIADRICQYNVGYVESQIKRKNYKKSWRKKFVEGIGASIRFETPGRDEFAISVSQSNCAFCSVNNQNAADYLARAITSRLEKEGFRCTMKKKSSLWQSNGLFDKIYWNTYTIDCTFEW